MIKAIWPPRFCTCLDFVTKLQLPLSINTIGYLSSLDSGSILIVVIGSQAKSDFWLLIS